MSALRKIHLYLGCIFAPLLVFFAISGMWQTLGLEYSSGNFPKKLQSVLALLSTLHTGRGLKSGATLSSPWMSAMIIAMAASLILTIVLGVVLAFRFGHRKIALVCLAGGTVMPLALCVARLLR